MPNEMRKKNGLAPQAEDNQETDKGIIFSLLGSCPLQWSKALTYSSRFPTGFTKGAQ